MLRRLAITLGDPAGIGPEVVLKALANSTWTENCEITVVGTRWVLENTYQQLRKTTRAIANPDHLNILDINDGPSPSSIKFGVGNASSGAASFAYLETAIASTLKGQFQGIVTGPIAKNHWKAAGHDYPGQTELLAVRSQVNRYGMLFVARSPHSNWTLRTLLATTHIPLSQVPQTLTPQLLDQKLDLLILSLNQDFGIKTPKIAVSGLNPHSGENGQLGIEEKDWLIPWIQQKRDRYPQIQLDGPIPPDTLWVKPGQAWYGQNTAAAHDAYLALYHDQGLIPVKLMAFDRAVNTTIGLPFIRTSPDHGTAFDIVGQGIADPSSFQAAIALAIELAHSAQPPSPAHPITYQ
ncbi:4-hydroxythreonine-4-phosphate dehydrogenase PdxA [Limnospira platensis]|uniref:4-hydroxythreonine-4-phosphate dehydrogenase PdxA n=1 Tax=Limnospira platensis TaxID=118562 RepID=UPI0002803F29|nr:4-hydroxythreonine-4-phosphate dehydrogenase [Arthrospira platensis C1]UWU48186.1 4-hydroxythreonine-4-phosphate dehydrogenase [Arthrospira platensis C1]